MTILEMALSKMQQLPIEKQQEALTFIEFLAFKMGDRQVKHDYSLIPAKRSLENLYGICAEYRTNCDRFSQSRYSNEHPAISTISHGCSLKGFCGLCLVGYFR
jgi:hypothetical protein